MSEDDTKNGVASTTASMSVPHPAAAPKTNPHKHSAS